MAHTRCTPTSHTSHPTPTSTPPHHECGAGGDDVRVKAADGRKLDGAACLSQHLPSHLRLCMGSGLGIWGSRLGV
eukprot:355559-Chlamydomonas_euryale.AAC.5